MNGIVGLIKRQAVSLKKLILQIFKKKHKNGIYYPGE